MSQSEMTKEQFDAMLREQIASGEITPDDAESEWDFFANGWDTYQKYNG